MSTSACQRRQGAFDGASDGGIRADIGSAQSRSNIFALARRLASLLTTFNMLADMEGEAVDAVQRPARRFKVRKQTVSFRIVMLMSTIAPSVPIL